MPEVKKYALLNDWENIAYWKEYGQIEVLPHKFGLSQIQLECLGRVTISRRFCNFVPHMATVFPALNLTQNCYINMNISFS